MRPRLGRRRRWVLKRPTGRRLHQSQPLNGSKLTTPLVLTGENDLVAGVQVRKGSASGWSDCLAPRTSGVLQVINPAATELLLINPDEVQAIADVTLWGEKGPDPDSRVTRYRPGPAHPARRADLGARRGGDTGWHRRDHVRRTRRDGRIELDRNLGRPGGTGRP